MIFGIPLFTEDSFFAKPAYVADVLEIGGGLRSTLNGLSPAHLVLPCKSSYAGRRTDDNSQQAGINMRFMNVGSLFVVLVKYRRPGWGVS